jgi:hypothetical protein
MPASAQHDKVMIVKVPYGSHFVTGTPALNEEKLYDHIFYQLVVDYDEQSWLGSSSASGGHALTSPYVHPRLKSLSHDEGVRNHRVLTESPVVYIVVFENNDAMRRACWLKDALGDKRPDKSGRYKSRYVVYVGETNNILKRTHQHLMAPGHLTLEGEEDSLESVQREIDQRTRADRIIQQAVADGCDVQQYVIWDTFFTKSMTLDIENKFIDYLWSLDDVFTLNSRGNAQRSYYMSETKDLVCSKVWRRLSLDNPFLFPPEHDIWNSELYKVSPFHSLGKEQSAAVNDICESVLSLIDGLPVHGETLVPTTSEHRLILIEGASGTGKSIVLSTLFVRLAEALRMPGQGDDGYGVHGSSRVSLVINQDQQLTLYRNLAKKIGLMSTNDDACVFKATQFINMVESGKREQPDVVLVDEAHLLRTTPHRSYPKKYHGNQLYDILLRAKVVVAVIDPVQVMRSSQHWDPEVLHALLPERTDPTDGSLEYAGPVTLRSNGNGSPGEDSFHSYRIMLTEQFRIDASDEVMRWIDRLADVHAVGMEPIPQDSLPRDMVHGVHGTKPYDIRVFGDADNFLDRLRGQPKPPPAIVDRIVVLPGAVVEQLEAPLAVEAHPLVEPGDELLGGDAAPVPAVEELVLEPAEEALRRRVVGAAALPGHRAGDAVLLADALPAGPAVVAAAVGVAERGLARPQRGAGRLQRRVGERGVRARAGRPGDGPAVEEVHDRAQVDLARVVGQAELGDVGDPLLVGGRGAEVVGAVLPQGQVGRRLVGLAGVGAVPPPAAQVGGHEAPLAHHGAHHLLAHADAPAPRRLVDEAVAAGAAALLAEDALHLVRDRPPPVGRGVQGLVVPVLIGTLRDPQGSGEFSQGPSGLRPQPVDQQRLLPVRRTAKGASF